MKQLRLTHRAYVTLTPNEASNRLIISQAQGEVSLGGHCLLGLIMGNSPEVHVRFWSTGQNTLGAYDRGPYDTIRMAIGVDRLEWIRWNHFDLISGFSVSWSERSCGLRTLCQADVLSMHPVLILPLRADYAVRGSLPLQGMGTEKRVTQGSGCRELDYQSAC